jgi:(S)-mandelate dehydrogenase
VRRGSDVIIAKCLGAKFSLFGRPTLFGAAVAGEAGIARTLQIVRNEIDMVMAQIGCRAFEEIHPGYLWPAVKDGSTAGPGATPAPGSLITTQETT